MPGGWKAIDVTLTLQAQQFESAMRQATEQVRQFESTVKSSGSGAASGMKEVNDHASRMSGFVRDAAASFAGFATAQAVMMGVGQAFRATVGELLSFDATMRDVNSLAGMSEGQFGNLEKQILNLSKSVPKSATDLANSMYYLQSAGFGPANGGMQVLTNTAGLATAGLTSTADATRATTAVMNAYGMQASDSAHVTNVLMETVKNGVFRLGDLNSVIGNVAGLSSAAKVPIQDVGAALATMSLAGMNADEAGTSYSRLIREMLKPHKDLAAAIHQMGFANGEAALSTLGLHGVMEKLRVSTGGNVEALLQLFPEIRAARGAFALMAGDGANYNRVSEEMKKADQGQGEMKKALAEQMKSLSQQWALGVNNMKAGMLEVGVVALPAVIAALHGLGDIGSTVWAGLVEAGHHVGPVLAEIMANLARLGGIAADAAHMLGPFIGLLAGAAVMGFVEALRAVSAVLGGLAGALSGHADLVAAAAAAWIAFKGAMIVGSVISSVISSLGGMVDTVRLLAMSYGEARAAGQGMIASSIEAKTAVTGQGSAMSLMGPIGLAAAVGIGAFAYESMQSAKRAQEGKKAADDFAASLNMKNVDLGSIEHGLSRINDKIKEGAEWRKKGWTDNSYKEEQKQVGDLEAKLTNANENIQRVMRRTGLSYEQVRSSAKAAGIDMTGSFDTSTDARDKLVADLTHTQTQFRAAGFGAQDMSKMSTEAITETKAQIDELNKYTDSVGQSFAKSFDVISAVSKTMGPDLAANRDQITNFYTSATTQAQTFSDNIQKAIQEGYSPALISRVLQAGPAQAAPFLASIVSGQSDQYVQMVNNAEKALDEMQAKVIAQARIVHMAENDTTGQIYGDVSKASQIQAMASAQPGIGSVQIAAQLKIDPSEVNRVVDEYHLHVAVPTTLDLAQAQAQMGGFDQWVASHATPEMKLRLNDSDVNVRMGAANELLNQWGATTKEGKAFLNTVDPNLKGQALEAWAAKWTLGNYTATANLNAAPATSALDQVEAGFHQYVMSNPNTVLLLQHADPVQKLSIIQGLFGQYVASNPTTTAVLAGDPGGTMAAARGVIDREVSTPAVVNVTSAGTDQTESQIAQVARNRDAHTTALADTAGAENALNNLTRPRSVSIQASVDAATAAVGRIFGLRHGGIMGPDGAGGMVQHFAQGGMHPQIGARGVTRVWNEPATGREAYVPEIGDTARAMHTLATAASWYGLGLVDTKAAKFAVGGMYGAGTAPHSAAPADGGIVRYLPGGSGSAGNGNPAPLFAPQITVNTTGGANSDQMVAVVRSEVIPTLNNQYSDFVRMVKRNEGR